MRNMPRSPLFVAATLLARKSVRDSLGISAALNSARHSFDAEQRSEKGNGIIRADGSTAYPPEA